MKIVDKATNTIYLGELSKYNGNTVLENAQMITEILTIKAEIYGIPQRICFYVEGKK